MIQLSFIIPAYNAGQYLCHCLDSIYALDIPLDEREVIVVDDGSTDNTATLLEDYRLKHDITVIKQPNSGLSMARNTGIDRASGKYLWFVDADDILLSDDLSDLFRYISEGIDIIGINMVERSLQGERYPYRRYVPQYNKVYRKAAEFMRGRNLLPCVVAYLFRREFLLDNELRFFPGIYHEDEEFTPRAFAQADSFVAVDTSLYERILHENSITTTSDREQQKRKLRDAVLVLKRLQTLKVESMQAKLDWLTVDTLRLLLRQKHDSAFCAEIVSQLRAMHLFPLRWRWQWKYMLFHLFTRLRFR